MDHLLKAHTELARDFALSDRWIPEPSSPAPDGSLFRSNGSLWAKELLAAKELGVQFSIPRAQS
jgi:hypothetical protein